MRPRSAETSEPVNQRARERLYIAARDCGHQQIFDHFVVSERIFTPGNQPCPQPGAVAGRIIPRLFSRRIALFRVVKQFAVIQWFMSP